MPSLPSTTAIGTSTTWNGMKQPNSIRPKIHLCPGKRHLVST
jgi:hypothetical protein